jgi:hypothetical protein
VNALRKLIFGETWILPLGIGLLLLGSEFLLKPILGSSWADAGGAILLVYVICLFALAINRS